MSAEHTAQVGDHVMLVSPDSKRIFRKLVAGGEFQTHHGVIAHDALIGLPWGSRVRTHMDIRYYVFQPTLRDLLLALKRRSQILYPKDIGYILLRLSIRPGSQILEAGTGSGGLTTALAWFVGPQGQVYGIDRRRDMIKLTAENLEASGLLDRVTLILGDISEPSANLKGLDAAFLDLPEPEVGLKTAYQALCPGGTLGAILPTANQVSELLRVLPAHGFGELDVCEVLLRFYKVAADRLRPTDRMVAHTGYLVFARRLSEHENASG